MQGDIDILQLCAGITNLRSRRYTEEMSLLVPLISDTWLLGLKNENTFTECCVETLLDRKILGLPMKHLVHICLSVEKA